MIFIVGGRGRLGLALFQQYSPDEVILVERAVYEHWYADDSTTEIATYFEQRASQGSVVYVCSGLLDPKLPSEELHNVNFRLPRNIIQAVSPMGIRAVTFGTAMEETLTANPYVLSKLELSRFINGMDDTFTRALHVRIHTLYGGGEPSPFMFLGLALHALRSNKPFEMTLGRQLREYHHVVDDAAAIRMLVDGGVTGVVALSHGVPVSLRSLAKAIFAMAGKSHLLRVGALPEPEQENFDQVFSRPEALENMVFRETLTGVSEYIKKLVKA